MSSVDERIVEMTFENGQFERGIAQTSKSLADFKSKLNLSGATKGLEEVSRAADGMKLDGISSNLDNISSKFNIFGAIGFTALQTLTNGAINLGTTLVKNVLDPLVQGGEKRAQNIAQAKFMLGGLGIEGKKLDTVMEAANYAVSGTAYGLDVAAMAASSFVASQVPIKQLPGALRAVSGVAAMTGRSYEDISQIFTTVAGNGRLMASELNRIGASGLNAAAALSKYLGVSETEVRKMTSDGKIDFETFAKAMDGAFGEQATKANDLYSGSLANMRAALARIGQAPAEGKFERLRLIFNALTPQIDVVKKALEPLLDLFKKLQIQGGKNIAGFIKNIDLSQLAPGFKNIAGGIKNIVKTFRAFGDMAGKVWEKAFPNKGAGTWFISLTKGFKTLTAALIPSKKTLETFGTALSVVAGIVSVVLAALGHLWDIFKAAGRVIGSVVGLLWDFVKPWLKLVGVSDGTTDSIGNFFDILRNGMDKGVKPVLAFLDGLREKIEKLRDGGSKGVAFFEKFGGAIKNFAKFAGEKVLAFFDSFKVGIESLSGDGNIVSKIKGFFDSFDMGGVDVNPLKTFGDWFKDIFKNLGKMLGEAWTGISPVVDKIAGGFESVLNGIGKFLSGIDLLDVMAVGQTAGIIAALVMLYKHMKAVNGLLTSASGVFTGFQDHLKAMQKAMKIDGFLKIAFAIGILVGALWVLSTIDTDKIWAAAAVLGLLAAGLLIFFAVVSKMTEAMTPEQAAAMHAMSTAMFLVAGSLLALAFAVKILSEIDVWGLVRGVLAVVGMLLALAYASKIMAKDGKGMVSMAFAIGILAGSLWLLVGVVDAFGKMDADALLQGGLTTAAALAALTTAMYLLSMPKNNVNALKAAGGIMVMVLSLYALAGVMQIFANMAWEDIGKGALIAGGALLFLGLVAAALSRFAPGAMAGSLGILVMAGALVVIAIALRMMQDLNPDRLLGSVLALAVIIGVLGLVAWLLGGVNQLMGAVSVVILAGSLLLLSWALSNMASIDPGALWSVVGALAVMTLLLGVVIVLLGIFPQATVGLLAVALVIGMLAGLVFSFSMVIEAFSHLVDSVVNGFVVFADRAPDIATGLVLLAKACGQIAPYAGDMFVIAAGLGVLGLAAGGAGLGFILLGGGILALAVGLALIIAVGPLGAKALTAVVEEILKLGAETGTILGLGAAFIVMGLGMILMSVGALLATLVGGLFAMMLMELAPALERVSPALETLATAAANSAEGILPLIGLGIGLFVFGMGAGAAGVGALALGGGLMLMATGLRMITAVGEAGADALVNISKKLAGLWTEAAKMGAVALALGGLGTALLGFGGGLSLSALGLTAFTMGMKLFNGTAPAFVQVLAIFAASLEPTAEAVASALAIMASAINENLPMMSANLLLFGLASMMAAPGLLSIAASMTSFSQATPTFLTTATAMVSGTKTLSESMGTNLEGLATTITASTTTISESLAALAAAVTGSIGVLTAAFILVGTTMMNAMTQGIQTGMTMAQVTIIIGMVAIITMLAMTVTGMAPLFSTSGMALGVGLATGFLSTMPMTMAAGLAVILALITVLNAARPQAQASGVFIMVGFVLGIRSAQSAIRAAGLASGQAFVNGVRGAYGAATTAGTGVGQAFTTGLSAGLTGAAAIGYAGGVSVGANIARGAANGVASGSSGVANAVRKMAQDAVSAAKAELDIHSPSRKFDKEIGFQVGAGWARGTDRSAAKVVGATVNVGKKAFLAMRQSVKKLKTGDYFNMEASPTIRPVMDLSEVQKSASLIGAMIGTQSIGPKVSSNMAKNHASNVEVRKAEIAENEREQRNRNAVNFTQINNSPKALSTEEVYRKTENLISKTKKLKENEDD